MKKLFLSVGAMALTAGTASGPGAVAATPAASSGPAFTASNIWIDPLAMDSQNIWIDPLKLTGRNIWIDPLQMSGQNIWIDPLGAKEANIWIDPLNIWIDPLNIWIDPLAFDSRNIWIDPLLSGTNNAGGSAFWGSFEPNNIWIDPLTLTSDNIWIDPLSLGEQNIWIDPLALEAQNIWIDPLAIEEANIWIDPLAAEGLSAQLEQLNIWIDPLLQADNIWIDPLSLEEANIWIDPLSDIDELHIWIEALGNWTSAMAAGDLDGWLSGLSAEELAENLAMLGKLQDLSGALEQLNIWIDPLALEEANIWIDPLSEVGDLASRLGSLTGALTAYAEAYRGYTGLLSGAESQFGAMVEEQTGQSFEQGFLEGFLDKHGLSGIGFQDFLRMSQGERNVFLIDMSDQLTTFLGIDHPDHWMPAAAWTPYIAEVAGYGDGVTVGVVDQGFDGSGGLAAAPESYGPVFEGRNHGRAVTGVLAGALDNRGVMGVAPEADIVLANPFSENGQAEMADVTSAIARVGAEGASVINLSLGEAGWTFSPEWLSTFGDAGVQEHAGDALFVMAAGNDGAVQSRDIDFGTVDAVERIMLVGALGLDGEIASFSNTPGEACFIANGACTPMMDRFLVAPGEQLLVATEDGVGRASGTSFAAPMVSGAAALLQSRWGWLADKPEATAEILFRSATDLGEEGIDGTYGHGLLNVAASQRPLDVSALSFRGRSGSLTVQNAALSPDLMARVEQFDTLTVFETVGDTFRDFEIPVGVLKAGVFDPSVSLQQDVERYFAERLGVASGGAQSVSGLGFAGAQGFTDAVDTGSVVLGGGEAAGWSLTLTSRRPAHGLQVPEGGLAFETHGVLSARETGLTVRFGSGDGALAFAREGFALTSDHDVRTGGVNPFLGLASGGRYLQAEMPLGDRFTLSGGFSARDTADLVVNPFSGELSERIAGTEGYRASAAQAAVGYDIAEGTTLRLGLTTLSETDGFLGGQTLGALSFGDTVRSGAVNASLVSALGMGFTLSLDATTGRSMGGEGNRGLLSIGEQGIVTTSYQAAVGKTGIFGEADRIRLSFAQPLHVEEGTLSVGTLDVTDRRTGELGLVADQVGITAGARRYVGEMIYGKPLFEGRGEVSLFGQVDTAPVLSPEEAAATGGLRFSVTF